MNFCLSHTGYLAKMKVVDYENGFKAQGTIRPFQYDDPTEA